MLASAQACAESMSKSRQVPHHVSKVELFWVILKLHGLCMSCCTSADLDVRCCVSTESTFLKMGPSGSVRLFNRKRPAEGATRVLQGSYLTVIWVCSFAASVADLAAEKTLLEVLVEIILNSPKASLQDRDAYSSD